MKRSKRAREGVGARARHATMIGDPLRTLPLLRAVVRAVRRGDSVVDVGTGLGLLAVAAAKAGAGRIVAIDCDAAAIADARREAAAVGVDRLIAFRRALSFDVKIPARADVLLCETVGSFAFDENILTTIADAKRRWLKPGGRIVPARLELWGAPLGRSPRLAKPADIARVRPDDLLGPPVRFAAVAFTKKIPEAIHAKPRFVCLKAGTVRAFACWPCVFWGPDDVTDASPFKPATHWQQGILPVEPRRVAKGDELRIEFLLQPHPLDPRLMTERLWRWIDG